MEIACTAAGVLAVVAAILAIGGAGKRKERGGGVPKMRRPRSREDDAEP